jgi:hypothetical protein
MDRLKLKFPAFYKTLVGPDGTDRFLTHSCSQKPKNRLSVGKKLNQMLENRNYAGTPNTTSTM